jgi:peptide-methionine (S)-S-oxide reductase
MIVRSLAALLGTAVLMGVTFSALAEAQQTPAPTQGETPAESGKTAEPGNPTDPKSASTTKTDKTKVKLEKATFATGCFWCGEAVFERIPGVKSVVSGYTGGNVPNPTYQEVGSGMTGHAEAIQIEYDPAVASYDKLLKVFWASHDPTTLNQQGPDFGTQYRSVIFYHNEDQKTAAQKSYQELTQKGGFFGAIVTQLQPMTTFYPAEAYHQDYFRKHKNDPYCQTYLVPKLKKLHLIK